MRLKYSRVILKKLNGVAPEFLKLVLIMMYNHYGVQKKLKFTNLPLQTY